MNVVIDGKLAILLEQHHGHGGELLGHGRDVEDRTGLDRDVVFEIGDSVALRKNEFAVLYDGH